MHQVLAAAGRAFVFAFGASIVVLAPGILAAPNLNNMYGLGVYAIAASVAAGLHALQAFVPKLSFQDWLPEPYGLWADTFAHAFLGTFLVLVIPVLNAPDLSTAKSAITGVLVGAFGVAFAALSGLFTKGAKPALTSGLAWGGATGTREIL